LGVEPSSATLGITRANDPLQTFCGAAIRELEATLYLEQQTLSGSPLLCTVMDAVHQP
jgi:hypothetical protein